MPCSVMYCCNDHRNGMPRGKAEAIELQFGEVSISLVGNEIKTEHFLRTPNDLVLKIGSCEVPALAYRSWVGNWCWDSCSVRAVHVVKLFNYLMGLKHWHCEEGPSPLFERFNAKSPVPPAEFRKLLEVA